MAVRTWDNLLKPSRWKEDSIPTDSLVLTQANDDRSPTKKDFDTVCNSSCVRRLQDKAQVFPLEECDFSRTRLTHSLETMAIAESLGDSAVKTIIEKESAAGRQINEVTLKRIYEIPIILRSAALLHDVGNPPFGHISEGVIAQWFADNLDSYYLRGEKLCKVFRGKSKKSLRILLGDDRVKDFLEFDGNAQVFRIVTRLQNSVGNRSLNLSYPLLATIIKYPYNAATGMDGNGNPPKKRGYFSSEQEIYEDIQKELELGDRRHPLVYLLEASDDISYLVSDIEDAGKKGLINSDQIIRKLNEKENLKNDCTCIYDLRNKIQYFKKMADYRKLPESAKEPYVMERVRIYTKGLLLSRVKDIFSENYDAILQGTYGECLNDTSVKDVRDALRELLIENVYYCREIVQNKIKSCKIIDSLLEYFIVPIFNHSVEKMDDVSDSLGYCLLSENYRHYCERQINAIRGERCVDGASSENRSGSAINQVRNQRIVHQKLLLLIDNISGMTDSFALRTYKTITTQ